MASNGTLYGIIGALGVVVVGGGLYIAKQEGAFGPPDKTAAVIAPVPTPAQAPALRPPEPRPPVIAAPQPPAAPAPSSGTSQAEAMLAQQLVSDARQAIARGDFNAADRMLDQAERLTPQSSGVMAARRELREARQRAHAGRGGAVNSLVADARAAIARGDYIAASRLLDQAETIDRGDHAVQEARAELTAAQRPSRR